MSNIWGPDEASEKLFRSTGLLRCKCARGSKDTQWRTLVQLFFIKVDNVSSKLRATSDTGSPRSNGPNDCYDSIPQLLDMVMSSFSKQCVSSASKHVWAWCQLPWWYSHSHVSLYSTSLLWRGPGEAISPATKPHNVSPLNTVTRLLHHNNECRFVGAVISPASLRGAIPSLHTAQWVHCIPLAFLNNDHKPLMHLSETDRWGAAMKRLEEATCLG